MPKNYVKCQNCGNMIYKTYAKKVYGKSEYICPACARRLPYATLNNTRIHTPKKHGKTYGFEFECVPRSNEHKYAVINNRYKLIPTTDASLPQNGVEFKSPTYYSLIGLRQLFKTLNTHLSFHAESCGQHINIGDENYINADTMETLRIYSDYIFQPLRIYMEDNALATTRVCGRYFNDYAMESGYSHYSWVNLRHDDRIEFRISKFVTPNQYFELTCMWTEMLDHIIANITRADFSSQVAKSTGEYLVNIFKKYENRKARCQKISDKTRYN